MATALLLNFYQELPERPENEPDHVWQARYESALDTFHQRVLEHYTEGTLQRLLDSSLPETRQAAIFALGLYAGMTSNKALAGMLHDEDPTVRQMASEAMWSIWFRAGTDEQNAELERLALLASSDDGEADRDSILAGFEQLIKQAPDFAEAYNQRAMFYFRLEEFPKAIKDCERALKLNAYHFAAAGGLAQCYQKQRKLRAALRAYRRSLRLNPNLEEVQEAIHSLEKTLGEEGKR